MQRCRTHAGDLVAGRVKGAAFREMVHWIEVHRGTRRLHVGYDRLLPEHKQHLVPEEPALGINASSWYPYIIAVELLAASYENEPDEVRLHIIRECVRYSMDQTFKGVYRMLFQLMVTPERAAKHVQRMWDLYYDSGTVKWTVTGPGTMKAEMRDWAGHTADGCEMLRQVEIYYLELMGCRDVQSTRTTCVADGRRSCTSIVTWSP